MDFFYILLSLLIGAALAGWVFYGRGKGTGELLGEERGKLKGLEERRVLDDQLQREAQREADDIKRLAFSEANEIRSEAERLRSEAERVKDNADRLRDSLREEGERQARGLLEDGRSRLEAESRQARENVEGMRENLKLERATVKSEREELRSEREELKKELERLNRRAEQLDGRGLKLDQIEEKIEKDYMHLQEQTFALEEKIKAADAKLFEVAGLSNEAAKEILFKNLEEALEEDRALRVRQSIEKANLEAKKKAQHIIAQAIQRSASETSAAMSVSVIPIPSDAMKGRIIGREGRNIRAFEQLTGVDLIIDDTPEAVILSSFNPIRREVAKHALEQLVQDGRIHPTRIEEVVHRAQEDMKTFIHGQGEEGALEAGVVGLKPGMMQLLGRMYFRTSYGQNVLKHSIQVAHITGILAAELGLDQAMARRAGLIHDIGKSIDREIEGSHVDIGISLAKRFGEPLEVIDAIAHHHDPENSETLFGVLVAAADAISAARPGARRESLETYIRRLEQLEQIAISFPGVSGAYAIQAGREVRVIVQPERVSDAKATLLAREIAGRIEQDMEYPGQVQVTVVRESRAVEIAK
jgi:ribonucrease Y